jgi:hypothetical protein
MAGNPLPSGLFFVIFLYFWRLIGQQMGAQKSQILNMPAEPNTHQMPTAHKFYSFNGTFQKWEALHKNPILMVS